MEAIYHDSKIGVWRDEAGLSLHLQASGISQVLLTETGAAKAVAKALPELAGCLTPWQQLPLAIAVCCTCGMTMSMVMPVRLFVYCARSLIRPTKPPLPITGVLS